MEDDQLARRLSWLTTAFCCFHVGWMAFHLGIWLSAFKTISAGLGTQLPPVTVFAMSISLSKSLPVGLLIIAGLVIKERLVKRVAVRHVITFLVFMVVTWFSWFCLDAVYKPLFEILDKIG